MESYFEFQNPEESSPDKNITETVIRVSSSRLEQTEEKKKKRKKFNTQPVNVV